MENIRVDPAVSYIKLLIAPEEHFYLGSVGATNTATYNDHNFPYCVSWS
jgi:hypothetical protein